MEDLKKRIKKKLAKSKTWKGGLGNRERPGGLKTRKVIQENLGIQKKKKTKKKGMTAKVCEQKDILYRLTNGDFLPEFYQWVFPQEASIATSYWILPINSSIASLMMSSSRKLDECWYFDVGPLPILPVLSHLIESIYHTQYI